MSHTSDYVNGKYDALEKDENAARRYLFDITEAISKLEAIVEANDYPSIRNALRELYLERDFINNTLLNKS